MAHLATMDSAWEERLLAVETAVESLKSQGLVHGVTEDAELDGRLVTLHGRRLVNFGSCSYLGLETDPRIKRAACEAMSRYGVVFSSSRAYLSVPLYAHFESLLVQMLGGYVLAAPTTSLAHLGALPVLVEDRDAVLIDAMAHNSMQAVLPTLRQRGVTCESLPHNRLERLERRARTLAETHRRVFYLCDGVYSMHGDLAPLGELVELLDRVPSLVAYVDDAHGIGWAGRNGAGVALGQGPLHERMVVALGFSKSFAAGGAALVLPRAELARRILTCGSTFIFSGPMQPAQLGAGIASAQIHLSPEIEVLQRRLRERIETFDRLAHELGVPLRVRSPSPIRFVEIGNDEQSAAVARALIGSGFFVNVAVFPAVARGRAGVRLMLTCRQTLADVTGLVTALAIALREHASSSPRDRAAES